MTAATLVLVPGLMCDEAVWAPLLPRLRTRADCRVADHGDADSLAQMAQRVLAAAPPRFALAGHSMGGRVALEVVRLAPERVARLALLDTGFRARAAGAAGDEETRKRQALLDLAGTQGVRAMAQQWVRAMVHPRRLDDAGLIGRIVAMFERKSAHTFAAQVRALLERPDATTVLQHLRVPTLVACGGADTWAPPAQHAEIAARIPTGLARLRVVDDAGHMAPMEAPDAVAGLLIDWLGDPPSMPC
jgi:pimeloyl-ACP methyl ester carboxylesterase